jgi:hypothetical protein
MGVALRHMNSRLLNGIKVRVLKGSVNQFCAAGASLLLSLLLGLRAQALDLSYTNNNGTITITGYTGPGGNVTIPSTIDGLPVTSIGDKAFYFVTGLTGVTIPDSVTSIGDDAFAGATSLTGIVIPDSVTNLGAEAFVSCASLASLTIGKGITTIQGGGGEGGLGTFMNCLSLTRITIPDNVTRIEDGAATLGGDVGAFSDCTSLTNVTIGRGLTYLGLGAFTWCTNLVGVYFRGNAPTHRQNVIFGEDIFHNAPATGYYLPGTTGWGTTYANIPAVLWNPQAQIFDGSFGVRQSRFGFNITGTADIPIVVEASTSLPGQTWISLQSCTLTNGLIYFNDAQWTNYPRRFYRMRSP